MNDDQFGDPISGEWPMPVSRTITARLHGLSDGDLLRTSDRGLCDLLCRPRIQVVTWIDRDSFAVDERRMTWSEWRAELLDRLRDWARRVKEWAIGWQESDEA